MNFERNIDPKKAMGIGMKGKFDEVFDTRKDLEDEVLIYMAFLLDTTTDNVYKVISKLLDNGGWVYPNVLPPILFNMAKKFIPFGTPCKVHHLPTSSIFDTAHGMLREQGLKTPLRPDMEYDERYELGITKK